MKWGSGDTDDKKTKPRPQTKVVVQSSGKPGSLEREFDQALGAIFHFLAQFLAAALAAIGLLIVKVVRKWPIPSAVFVVAAAAGGVVAYYSGHPLPPAVALVVVLGWLIARGRLKAKADKEDENEATAQERRFTDLWTKAWQEGDEEVVVPSLVHLQLDEDSGRGVIHLPPASVFTWQDVSKALHPTSGRILRRLDIGGTLGAPMSSILTPSKSNPAKTHDIVFSFIPPERRSVWDIPSRGRDLIVVGLEGAKKKWKVRNTKQHPHLLVQGGTGSGKGGYLRQARFLLVRDLRTFIVVNGSGAPEFQDVKGYPLSRTVEMSLTGGADEKAEAHGLLDRLIALADERQDAMKAATPVAGDWYDMPREWREANPLLDVFIDELWNLLNNHPDLREKYTQVLRLLRKVGVKVTAADQITYVKDSDGGAQAQFGQFLALGDLKVDAQKMVANRTDLPPMPIPNEEDPNDDSWGRGSTGARGPSGTLHVMEVTKVGSADVAEVIRQARDGELVPVAM